MKWADVALRFFLRDRDRETISGDLLEEYREEVLPKRGPLAGRLWYARQVASFVSPVAWGLAIGLAAGTLQLLDTAIEPLADDSAGSMIVVLGVLMLFWILTSIAAGRRTQRFRDAVAAGLVVSIATMTVLHLAAIIRVNVFLDQIRHRDDWLNLVAPFHASEFQSLRAYANYEYFRQTPLLLALAGAAGGLCGMLGGAINRIARTSSAKASR
jgi:hypothetical protein